MALPDRPAILRKSDASRVVRQTVESERRLRGGGEGPSWRALVSYVPLLWVRTPVDGIPARTKGVECELYDDIDEGTISATETVAVNNTWPDDVAGGKLMAVEPGTLRALPWSCAAAPTTPMTEAGG